MNHVATDKKASAKADHLSAKTNVKRHDQKPKDKYGHKNHGKPSKYPKKLNGQKANKKTGQDKDNIHHNFDFLDLRVTQQSGRCTQLTRLDPDPNVVLVLKL